MGWGFFGGSGLEEDDPVSIWTTCLKEWVSAWTKVVGYGLLLLGSDLGVMGLGVVGVCGGCSWWRPLLLLLLVVLVVLWLFGDGFWLSWRWGEVSILVWFRGEEGREERERERERV